MRTRAVFLLCALPAFTQHQHMQMPENPAAELLMRQASGTEANPASAPNPMLMTSAGGWDLMLHGMAFINEIQQTGPRGGDKFFSTNWVMGMAQRTVGRGVFLFRMMNSLEPATVTERRYPELFQTGETAFGRPIVDGQHPHDLFMELAVEYARPLGERALGYVYLAPVGDPALGPVAFPHRVSAMELPQAPLSHHLQDSTHIANEVITAGLARGMFRIEASGFHGAEPNENRWNIDHGPVDSWSARLTVNPGRNWSGQVSVGRLTKPEAAEPGDIVRSTASITYNRPLAGGKWASSIIWGRNHKTPERRNLNSYLAESALQFTTRNFITGRVELVDKDELFPEDHAHNGNDPFSGQVFRIAAYTLGYTRDVGLVSWLETGLGANFTLYTLPAALKPVYGDRPAAFLVYLRMRLRPLR